jgi:outer membrane lipoprotein-sorting protein
MLDRRTLIGALALGLSPLARALVAPAWAATPPPRPMPLNSAQQAEVAQVQVYLNSIRTLSSRFEQSTLEGGSAVGQLYMSRPGRMRFEYDPPVPILMVADGRDLYYYDRELQQVTPMRINETPAGFLLAENIQLAGDVTLVRYEHKPGAIRLTLVQTKDPSLGSVTLVLADRPLELRQWTVVDPQLHQTTVTLTDPHYGAALDPKLFYWTDPRPSNPEK